MENFKLFGGHGVDDVGLYIKDYIKANVKDHSELIIYVGTDSKQMRKHTMYATAIVLYHVRKGAHIIFNRTKVPKVKDLFTRLYNEVEMTRVTAEELYLEIKDFYNFKWNSNNIGVELGDIKVDNILKEDKEKGTNRLERIIEEYNKELLHVKPIICDIDLNPNNLYKSFMVYDTGVGTLKGSGFRVRSKPNAWAASGAADLLCK